MCDEPVCEWVEFSTLSVSTLHTSNISSSPPNPSEMYRIKLVVFGEAPSARMMRTLRVPLVSPHVSILTTCSREDDPWVTRRIFTTLKILHSLQHLRRGRVGNILRTRLSQLLSKLMCVTLEIHNVSVLQILLALHLLKLAHEILNTIRWDQLRVKLSRSSLLARDLFVLKKFSLRTLTTRNVRTPLFVPPSLRRVVSEDPYLCLVPCWTLY